MAADTTNRPALSFETIPATNLSLDRLPILLIHGGFSSHHDFHYVAPLLCKDYTLLIPDLPSHGISASSKIPFHPRDTAALLADLVSKNSPTGKVHIVGVSLGGYSALILAALHPNVVETVFVTGCGRVQAESAFRRTMEACVLGAIFPTIIIIIAWLPPSWHKSFYAWQSMKSPDGLQEAQRAAAGWTLGWSLAQGLLNGEFTPQLIERVTARTVVCAAELDDGLPGAKGMGELLQKGNAASLAVQAKNMRHVWCLQDEDFFVRAVVGWIESAEVVEGLEIL